MHQISVLMAESSACGFESWLQPRQMYKWVSVRVRVDIVFENASEVILLLRRYTPQKKIRPNDQE